MGIFKSAKKVWKQNAKEATKVAKAIADDIADETKDIVEDVQKKTNAASLVLGAERGEAEEMAGTGELFKGFPGSDRPLCIVSNGASCGSAQDNVQNYMEYSYCSRMFTQGQANRMRAALQSNTAQRNQLWTSANLAETGVLNPPLCAASFTSSVSLRTYPFSSIRVMYCLL